MTETLDRYALQRLLKVAELVKVGLARRDERPITRVIEDSSERSDVASHQGDRSLVRALVEQG